MEWHFQLAVVCLVLQHRVLQPVGVDEQRYCACERCSQYWCHNSKCTEQVCRMRKLGRVLEVLVVATHHDGFTKLTCFEDTQLKYVSTTRHSGASSADSSNKLREMRCTFVL